MSCPQCQSPDLDPVITDLARLIDGHAAVLRNVPARRCAQCGYLLLSAQTGLRIERALTSRRPDGTETAAVYDLARVREVV